MIYPSDFERKIGFTQVRSLLRDRVLSTLGADCVDAMKFISDRRMVEILLRQTAEMSAVMASARELPTENIHDLRPWLTDLRAAGAIMSAERLYKLRLTLLTMARIRDFFSIRSEGSEQYPELSRLFAPLEPFPAIAVEIDRVINKFGEVKDSASPLLGEIRGKIRSVQASMANLMRRVIQKAAKEGIVDPDTCASVRDGRLVVPVAAGKKRELGGIIHDESSSGKTVYVEPAEVVEASNRLRELELEETREINVILSHVADLIRPEIDAILRSVKLLGLMDFIRAKAIFAADTGGELPAIADKPEIDWFGAVHPILRLTLRAHGKTTVPLNLHLDRDQRFLIISGPNAGGKSVALKTVAIVQYMLQCGMLPTMHSNSHAGIFRNIFIDIGDEQSIENDLSTYSSHLVNMKYFLSHADASTLVLADEMGSGTEPQIGSALAQAILTQLGKRGAFGVITTHYQNLKRFASEEPGFVNGAMLYDRARLQPLFQLTTGTAGSSFALDIARKTGLPDDVVEMAKELVGSDYVNTDKFMLDIARDRRYWANKRLSIREKEHKMEQRLDAAEQRAEELRKQRAAILAEARREAAEILAEANARIERTILEIRKAEAEKERTKEVRRELEEYKRSVKEAEKTSEQPALLKPQRRKHDKTQKQNSPKPASKELKPGDYVKMSQSGTAGKILSIKGNNAEVAFGGLRTFVKLGSLIAASAPKPGNSTVKIVASDDDSRSRQLNFKQEIDVRGMRADEAMQTVTYFLDDAVQFSIPRVRILHGTGTGALREAIRRLLRSNPVVEDFHDEDVRFGGAGITVVNLS